MHRLKLEGDNHMLVLPQFGSNIFSFTFELQCTYFGELCVHGLANINIVCSMTQVLSESNYGVSVLPGWV